MAIVPTTTGQTVDSRPAAFVPQNAQYTPDAFGAGIGQAERQFGGTSQQVAADGVKVATDLAITSSIRATKTADAAHQSAVTDLGFTSLPGGPEGNKGFYSLRGQAAVDALPAYKQAMQDANDQTLKSLGDDTRAQDMYQKQSALRIQGETARAAHYGMTQGMVADDQASQARVGSYNDALTANYNDPRALATFQQVTANENADQARRNGWTKETADQQLKATQSKGYKDAILAAVTGGDVALGASMFKTLAPQMDAATRVGLAQHLEPIVTGAVAQDMVNTLMGKATPAMGTASDVSQAIRRQEGPGVSIQGANEGIMPATFKQYAKPGEDFNSATDRALVHSRIINDLSDKAGGDPARIAVGYFSGPGNMAPAGAVNPWLNDRADANGKTVSGYVRDVLGRMQSPHGVSAPVGNATDANTATYPDFAHMQQTILDQTDGNPKLQAAALSRLSAAHSQYELQTQSDRDRIQKSSKDIVTALEKGDDTVAIPEAEIRHSFRPGVAEPLIEQMQEARAAGQIYSSMQFATPDQIAGSRQALADGLGPLASISRLRGRNVVSPPGADGTQQDGDATGAAQRVKDLALFDRMLAQRQREIGVDPAGFAMTEPGVKQAFASAGQGPREMQAAIARMQTVQKQVGVSPDDVRTVTNDQAAKMVKALHTTTPEKGDMGQQLNMLQQQYGASYPGLVADLTKAGLSPTYQMLAHAALPEQTAVREDLQRALQTKDAMKDKGEFGAAVPVDQKHKLEPAIDAALANFRQTTATYGNTSAYDTVVHPSVKTLATYYASQGMPAEDAATRAASLVNKSYEFDGALRVPKGPGMPPLSDVRSAQRTVMSGLKDEDLKGTTAAEAGYSGKWFTNPDDSGATLLKGTLQGGYLPVRRADGSRVSIDFKNLPKPQVAAAAPLDMNMGVMQ